MVILKNYLQIHYPEDLKAKEKISTEELLKLCKENSEVAKILLINRFTPFIFKCANRSFAHNYDREDFVSEGTIALLKAAEKFDPSKGNFTSYAMRAISNSMYDLMRKGIKTEDNLSFEYSNEDGLSFQEIIASDECVEKCYEEKQLKYLLRKAVCELPSEEKDLIVTVYFNNCSKFLTLKDYSKIKNMKYSKVLRLNKESQKRLKKQLENPINMRLK